MGASGQLHTLSFSYHFTRETCSLQYGWHIADLHQLHNTYITPRNNLKGNNEKSKLKNREKKDYREKHASGIIAYM
jgi:hypothetical protein